MYNIIKEYCVERRRLGNIIRLTKFTHHVRFDGNVLATENACINLCAVLFLDCRRFPPERGTGLKQTAAFGA